jgi:hypothetical protein
MAQPDAGKLLWEVVSLRLKAQDSSQAALTGRAKDMIGLATISSTITGVF